MGIFPTDQPRFDKPRDEISIESAALEDHLRKLARATDGDPSSIILAHGLSAIYERLGEMWMWMQERR